MEKEIIELTPECKNCPHLNIRYGYCNVVQDWVTKPINKFSFEHRKSR